MRPIAIAAVLVLLTAGPQVAQEEPPYPPESRCKQSARDGSCSRYGVSLVELIANPQTWDGKPVRVIGYLNLEFEGDGIYLHEEDYTRSISNNGLWVGFAPEFEPPQECGGQYALIEGTFDARNTGHMGMWSGAIVNIDRCDPWKRLAQPPVFAPPPPG